MHAMKLSILAFKHNVCNFKYANIIQVNNDFESISNAKISFVVLFELQLKITQI